MERKTHMKVKIEKLLNITLPERLQKFWGGDEHLEYSKLKLSGIPEYQQNEKFKVRFNDFDVFDSFMNLNRYFHVNLNSPDYPKQMIPLSYLYAVGDVEENYLTVDIHNNRHPVFLCINEKNVFIQISEDFDAFLKLLQRK